MREFVTDEQLEGWLGQMRLPWIRDRLSSLLQQAVRDKMALRDFLVFLCEHELRAKREARMKRRMSQAHFPVVRTLADFDFSAQPSVNPDVVRDLSGGHWVGHGDNVLLLGPPGVGKTHLAIALGRAIIERDYSVAFMTCQGLAAQLMLAQRRDRWDECLHALSKPQLLIVDEFGYLPMPPSAAHLLFQVIAARYERGSILLTSNQAFSSWGEVLGDQVVATAILDRLLHHSQVLMIKGESYRLREKRASGLIAPAQVTDPSVE